MRRVGLVCVLAFLAVAAAGTWTSSAAAYSGGPNTPITDPAYRQQVKSLLRAYQTNPAPFGTNVATGAPATAAEVESGLTIARGNAAILPRLTTLTAGALAIASAGYVGWKIGTPIGGYIYKRITGDTYGGTVTNLVPGDVRWMTGAAISSSYSGFFGGGALVATNWYFNYGAGTVAGAGVCTALTVTCPAGAKTQAGALLAASTYYSTASGRFEYQATGSHNLSVCNSPEIAPSTSCGIYWMSQREFENRAKIETDNEAGYNGAALKKDAGSWTPPQTTTDADLDAALDSIGANDSATGSKSQEAAIGAINHALDPGWEPGQPPPGTFTPFALPEPEPDMTYQQYVATLRARGWLGTLTIEPASALESGADPASDYAAAPLHAPAGILVGGSPIVWRFDLGAPLPGDMPDPNWPDNPPHVPTSGTPITIKEKPPTSILPPPGGGDPGECECDVAEIVVPSVDSPCDKFPFGVFCWIGGAVDALFLGDAEAPHFHFVVGEMTFPGGFELPEDWIDYTIDLDELPESIDGYISLIRLVLTFVVWFFGLFYMGRRLLGADAPNAYPDEPDHGTWGDGSQRTYG